METLAERLATLRHDRRWTLANLAASIERTTHRRMSKAYLRELELGRKSPTVGRIAALAAGYGMTIQELLTGVTVYPIVCPRCNGGGDDGANAGMCDWCDGDGYLN